MPTTLEDEFGDIIQKARAGQGYSLDDVSRMTEIEASILADFEAYRRAPSDDQIRALASALNLNPIKLAVIAAGTWGPEPDSWRADSRVAVSVVTISLGGYAENCYILGCRETSRALIVDPGGRAEQIGRSISEAGLTAEAIAVTHGHSDHTGGISALADRFGLRTVIGHPADIQGISRPGLAARPVTDGDEFYVGAMPFRVLHTPGHTPGSVCYLTGLLCLVGDTLFAGSLGRAGGKGAYESLLGSVREKILSLPGNAALLPGHGPATTVSEELDHNPFF